MPEIRDYKKPVAWLGGRDLLANLKTLILFATFSGKLDPRDWMKAEIFPPPLPDPAEKHYEREKKYIEEFNRSFNSNGKPGEFWFDYFADSGDGMTAGYAIAYLCLSDLTVNMPADWEAMSPSERSAAIRQDRVMAEARSRFAALEDPARKLTPAVLTRIFVDTPERILKDCKRRGLEPEIVAELRRLSQQGNQQVLEYLERTAIGVIKVPPAGEDVSAANCPLPRGAFLFVGGDTSYHVADFAGLGLRFQKVFDWAYEDLKKKFKLTDEQAEAKYWQDSVRRPLFGVPGNHDYYDMIDGFNRQFGRPITRETNFINLDGRDMSPQLRLRHFRRFQTASYIAIQLPMGWWFWGVDSELERVDIRQQEYFKRSFSMADPRAAAPQVFVEATRKLREDLKREPTSAEIEKEVNKMFPRIARLPNGDRWPIPEKLIVATPEPTTVEGRRARHDENTRDKTARAFTMLGLDIPFIFLPGTTSAKAVDNRIDPGGEELTARLAQYKIRLDISGDVHHYARYWGNDAGENADAVSTVNYASVVAGGGGASMSPTQTDYGEVEEQTLYPDKKISQRVINSQLFRPWVVIRGGNVWVAGLIIGLIVIFGATSPGTHYEITNRIINASVAWLTNRAGAGIGPQEIATIQPGQSLAPVAKEVKPWQIVKLILLLLLAGGGIAGAGIYMKLLFDRLTKTHDWVHDKLENLRLAERLRKEPELMEAAAMRVGSADAIQEDAEAKDERDYQTFLKRAQSIKSLQKKLGDLSADDLASESAFATEYQSSKILQTLYRRFLNKTETQKNPGIAAWRLWRFWIHSLVYLVPIIGLWVIDSMVTIPQPWDATLYLAAVGFTSLWIYRSYKNAKALTDELRKIENARVQVPVRDFWRVIQLSVHPIHDYVPFWALLLCPGLGVLLLAWWNYEQMSAELPGFGNSMAILFAVLVAGVAAVVANLYSGWLFQQAYRIKVNLFSYIPVIALTAVALLTLVTAIARAGRDEARYVLTDGLFVIAVLMVILGCMYLGAFVGNHLSKASRRIGFALLGLWHGLLQLLVPFVLIWFGDGRTFAATFFAVIIFTAIPLILINWKADWLITKRRITLLWLLFGFLVMFVIPYVWHRPINGAWQLSELVVVVSTAVLVGILTFALADRSTKMRVLVTPIGASVAALVMWALYNFVKPLWATWLLAGLIGAVMSCVWLGWYFAVSLVFDGHANEAGSTARTEDYKHFIRFRLTEDSLTGFVIGIDFPRAPQNDSEPDGSANKPRLIDVFTLKAHPARR